MVYEVERGRACGELVTYQANEIQKGLAVEVELREANKAQSHQIVSLTQEKAIAYGLVEVQADKTAIQEDLTKHERRQKNKWRLAAVAMGVVVVLQVVFSP